MLPRVASPSLRFLAAHVGAALGIAFLLLIPGRVGAVQAQGQTSESGGVERPGLVMTLEGHTKAVSDAAFSPDGRFIITGGFDSTARIWDAATGKLVRKIPLYESGVWSVAFSPDGRYFLTSSSGGKVDLWDAKTGYRLRTFNRVLGLYSASFSPNSQLVVTSGIDNVTNVWSVTTGKQVHSLSADTTDDRSIRSAIFSPNGNEVVTGNYDGIVTVWDTATEKVLRSFGGTLEAAPIASVAYSPDGRYILVGGDPVVYLRDAKTGALVRSLSGHTDDTMAVAFSPDGKYIVTASDDKTANLWETSTGKLVRTLVGHTAEVYSAAFSPDGKYIVTGSRDKTARVWKVDDVAPGQARTN